MTSTRSTTIEEDADADEVEEAGVLHELDEEELEEAELDEADLDEAELDEAELDEAELDELALAGSTTRRARRREPTWTRPTWTSWRSPGSTTATWTRPTSATISTMSSRPTSLRPWLAPAGLRRRHRRGSVRRRRLARTGRAGAQRTGPGVGAGPGG